MCVDLCVFLIVGCSSLDSYMSEVDVDVCLSLSSFRNDYLD